MIPDESVPSCCSFARAARRDQIATREDGVDASGVVGDARPSVGRARARGARRVACRAEDDVERSNYKDTSSAVKNLVSGLTALVNAFGESGGREGRDDAQGAPRGSPLQPPPRPERAGARHLPRVHRGEVPLDRRHHPEMYDLFCTFTDPTLSFVGLETFERNLKNLQPVLRRLVRDSDVELYACELAGEDERWGGGDGRVRASWRMTGNLRLPWRPRIDLEGRTTFTFRMGGRTRVPHHRVQRRVGTLRGRGGVAARAAVPVVNEASDMISRVHLENVVS